MKEIEVKILEIDKESVIRKLLRLGAKKEFEGDIDATIFDFPDGRLAKQHSLFRIRKKGNETEVTFKTTLSKGKAKVAEELNISIDDRESMFNLVKSLGMVETRKAFKKRISFVLGDVHFEIEEIPGIPPYLEIEVLDMSDLEEAVSKLGFSMKDTVDWNMFEVVDYYQARS